MLIDGDCSSADAGPIYEAIPRSTSPPFSPGPLNLLEKVMAFGSYVDRAHASALYLAL
jgi:hypothetical protein